MKLILIKRLSMDFKNNLYFLIQVFLVILVIPIVVFTMVISFILTTINIFFQNIREDEIKSEDSISSK
jgi:uncharacterized membrane protein (DUF485 family)